ncbi:MAG: hypothetical protein WC748_09385 [Legionellales bacterium]|jgi:hypothetical protein
MGENKSNIETLTLEYCDITDAGVAVIAPIKSLNWLMISSRESKIGDKSAEVLAKTKLTHLDLHSHNLTGKGAKFFLNNTRLTTLNLAGNKISESGNVNVNNSAYLSFS